MNLIPASPKRLFAILFAALLPLLCSLPQLAQASQWQAVQGDVLVIELPVTGKNIQINAFGKTWPWKQVDGQHIKAWVGIDLKAKPGNHTLLVRGDSIEQRHQLKVTKGDFRISRIEVTKKMAEFDAPTLKRIRADQAAIKATYAMQVKGNPDISIA